MTSRSRNMRSLARRSSSLALAVPEVVAHRVSRAMLAGASPSAADRREFHLMGAEKVAAFYESWGAMFMQNYLASVRLWSSPGMWMSLMANPRGAARRLTSHQHDTALAMMTGGLAPISRRAVANATRLRRKRK
ncbi:MAG TPA: polyhydroxyalkanoate granule-associated phasin [Usitatibacter sp.]|jgi:hypothetical protein|nr:polyhydroxyalkanoate granule-associated phasin [Usitatibacter sp.]